MQMRSFGLLVVIATALNAAPPVATVSSSTAFRLRGSQVRVEGIPQWPMRAGDEIIAGSAPAMITFNGGTQVYLNANSRAKLITEGRGTVLRLMNGDMAYKIAQQSPVSIAGLSDTNYATAKTGRVSVLENRAVYSSVDSTRWAGVAPIVVTPGNIYSIVTQVRNTDALSRLPNDPGAVTEDTPITIPTTPLSPLSYR